MSQSFSTVYNYIKDGIWFNSIIHHVSFFRPQHTLKEQRYEWINSRPTESNRPSECQFKCWRSVDHWDFNSCRLRTSKTNNTRHRHNILANLKNFQIRMFVRQYLTAIAFRKHSIKWFDEFVTVLVIMINFKWILKCSDWPLLATFLMTVLINLVIDILLMS